MLFADDAALASHTETGLQQLVDRLSFACKEFTLTISIKKTHVMAQDVENPPSICIGNTTLDCVDSFTYLGSTVFSNLSLDAELSTRLARAAAVMAIRLAKSVWLYDSYTCTYMCIHVHTCAYMYIHVHICTCMYMYVHVCTYMYIHVHTCTYMYMYVHVCTCMHMYAHVCTCITVV